MNDLDHDHDHDLHHDLRLVRAFRGDAPRATPAGARDALLRELRPARRSPARWLASAAVLAVGAGGVVALQGGPGAPPSEAAVVLHRAAATVAAADEPRPRPRQWFYVTNASHRFGEAYDDDPALAAHGYFTFDGSRYADPSSDQLGDPVVGTVEPEVLAGNVTPQEAYDAAAALPADPADLLDALGDSQLADPAGDTAAARDYDAVVDVLEWGVLPAQARADLFRALATIPGVAIDEDAAPDLLGRPVLAVTFADEPALQDFRVRRELLLDPRTYAFLGTRETALEPGRAEDPGFAAVDVEAGDTSSRVRVGPVPVDRPGRLPGHLSGDLSGHRP